MAMEKTIDFTQSYVIITMNVTGDSIRKKVKKCRTMCKKLRWELALLIGAETIEIIKPKYIERGLEIKFHVYLTDKHMKQIDYEKVLVEANKSNELADIIKVSWDLTDNPKISDIHSMIIESKHQQRIHSTNIEMLEQQHVYFELK